MRREVRERRGTLSLLDLPADPLDSRSLAELPLETLQRLVDLIYQQLDTPAPSHYAFDWYSALSEEWARRMGPVSRTGKQRAD